MSLFLMVFMKKIKNAVKLSLLPMTVTLVILILFRFVFLLGYVPTASMEPTLKTGSLILGVRVWRDIRKRDIIVFRHNKEYLVKRVEAVGGDLIERNGEDLVVPEGGFYVLGDNGQCSWDSRYWDDPFVPESAIVAKVWLPPGN